jgi:hypothetical protein
VPREEVTGDGAPTGLDGTRHRVVSRAPWTGFRIKGSAIIMPLNRCDFMAEIGQHGKEQIFPWAAQGALLQGISGFMIAEKFHHGFCYQTITELLGEVHCIVETDEDIRKQVLLVRGRAKITRWVCTTVVPSHLTSVVVPRRTSASVYVGFAMGRLLPNIGAKSRAGIEYCERTKIKPILLRSKRHVCNSALDRLSGFNQLVENVLGYVDFDDRIPTAHIARG